MDGRVIFNLILTSFLSYKCNASYTCCPDGWIPYQGSCYLFRDEERLDWYEARTYCHHRNSFLVEAETKNENAFLMYYSRKLYNIESLERNVSALWLGASDEYIEGIWKWVELDEEITYFDWSLRNNSNQPITTPDNHYDCLVMTGLYDFLWRDAPCRARIGYPICEKKDSHSSSTLGEMQLIG